MIVLNLNNVEELIFSDNKLQNKLSEFKHLFDSWKLSQRFPSLRSLGKRSASMLLQHLSSEHKIILEQYFQNEIKVDILDNRILKNINTSVEDLHRDVFQIDDFSNIALSRNGDQIYISCWR
jgi:hypothetical protein